MKNRWNHLSLFYKFAAVIICVGLVPMTVLSTVIMNRMLKEYGESLKANYEQAAVYANSGIDMMLESYNGVSKMPYYYNYTSEGEFQFNFMSFDNLRKILYGVGYEPDKIDETRKQNMHVFLQNVQNVDESIIATHFVADNQMLRESFHCSSRNSFFYNEEQFQKRVRMEQLDRNSKQMILIPTHPTDYYNKSSVQVFTIGRNYFDLTKPVGNTDYIGTLYLDVDLERLAWVFQNMRLGEEDEIFVLDRQGNCFYSSVMEEIGTVLDPDRFQESAEQLVIETAYGDYGLKTVVVMKTEDAYRRIYQMQRLMYGILAASVVSLLFGSVVFSRRLTRPIHRMMEQMSQIESGNFKVQLPVDSSDEIGVLSQRFNQMSQELETYINKSYVAQLKQNEAEMTALKAQIYPHFLYNTLEIIRMTALENEDEKVSRMIEALSQQIHYIIGPVKDMVPLEMEVDIIRKYIYLLNCRIAGKVQLAVDLNGASGRMVPKLILQPIVENAYVHGLKPKGGGNIMIDVEVAEHQFVISLMDNGVGMDVPQLEDLKALLDSDAIGIKNEHNWQSIGLKNVHDRIRYLYGKEYGLDITSTPGVGTMVRIIMPEEEK